MVNTLDDVAKFLMAEYKSIEDKRAVLLQSGGLDSLVCATLLNKAGFVVHNIFVDYGQNSKVKEEEYAEKISAKFGSKLSKVTLSLPWLADTSNLVSGEVNDSGVTGSFNTISSGVYVPLRNTMLLSIAGSYAEAYQIPYIVSALDGSQDEDGNPTGGTTDKHPLYVEKVESALNEGSTMFHLNYRKFHVLTPIMSFFKSEIIQLGNDLGVDFSFSWSCYNSSLDKPCGHCSACDLRKEAFSSLGLNDPAYD